MAAFSLKKYIKYREGVDILDSLEIKSSLPQSIHQDQKPENVRPRHRYSLPVISTDNFEKLVVVFRSNPRLLIRATLGQLTTELLELEKMYEVALLNPAVTHAGRLARESWKRAEKFWNLNLIMRGHLEAQEAVSQQIKSLIGAYQTTAASKIVDARQFMESSDWQTHPLIPLAIHKKARTFYQKGRDAQKIQQNNQARSAFSESIIEIEKLYLESERLLKTHYTDEIKPE